jgi:hypothetical protein
MMNKQIDRDLEAQKQNQGNANNIYSLMNLHEIQKAQTEDQFADAALKTGVAAKTFSQLAHLDYIKRNFIDKMPEGPLKERMKSYGDLLKQGITQDINQRNAAANNQISANKAQRGLSDTGVNDSKLLYMQRRGEMAQQAGLVDPNGIDPGDMQSVRTQASLVKTNRATANSWYSSFKALNDLFLAGKLNEEEYNAQVGNFRTTLAKQIGEDGADKSIQSMFPSWRDWGKSRSDKFNKTVEHFHVNESGTDGLDKYGLKTPFPQYIDPTKTKQPGNQSSGGATEGTTGKDAKGNPWTVRNGKRIYD